jgi:hypothetical protein
MNVGGIVTFSRHHIDPIWQNEPQPINSANPFLRRGDEFRFARLRSQFSEIDKISGICEPQNHAHHKAPTLSPDLTNRLEDLSANTNH